MIRTILIKPLFVISLVLTLGLIFSTGASAVTGSDWKAGRIIDDQVFFDKSQMTINDIQAWLNARVPVCDTWGQKAHSSGMSRADYGRSVGVPPPYICVKDYYENPSTHETNFNPTATRPAGSISAAQIIYNAAQQYSINPKAILVTIQKEAPENLLGDDWPWLSQYRAALGYGCPDTAPCDAEYYGFYNQVQNAAMQFRRYATYPHEYRYKAHETNFIQFNPSSACSGSYVFIDTQATAGLYNYTPYQPNTAALNNLYGTGDGCSAYGNRNFWRIYHDWFGSTYSGSLPLPASNVNLSTTEATIGQPVTVTYTVTNPFSYPITVPSIGVSNRMNGQMYDFDVKANVSFAAREQKTFTATFTPNYSGAYSLAVAYNYYQNWYAGGHSWLNVHTPLLSVTGPITVSPEFPVINQPYTVSFTIKNNGGLTAYLKYLMAANYSGSTPAGFKAVPLTLAPGQSYTYSDTRTPSSTDNQKSWIAYQLGDLWYRLGNDTNHRAYTSPANLKLISPITLNPRYPSINSPTSATFKVKNFGDQPVRLSNMGLGVQRTSDNARFDFTGVPTGFPILLKGGETYSYNASRSFPTKSTYNLFLTSSYDGVNFSGSNITSDSPDNVLGYDFNVFNSPAKLEFTKPLTTTPSNGPQGQIETLNYQVTNTGDAPTGDITLAFYCRFNKYTYCDIPGRTVNLASGQSAELSSTAGYFSNGQFTFQPLKYENGRWGEFGTAKNVDIWAYTPPKNAFTTTLSLDKASTTAGQPVTATYTIRNNTIHDIQLPVYAVASRLNGAFYDFGLQRWFYLRAGETKTFTSTFTTQVKGTYTLFPVLNTSNDTWYGYDTQTITVQ